MHVYGGIFEKGGPPIVLTLLLLLFNIYVDYYVVEMQFMLVFYSGICLQDYRSATLSKDINNLVGSQVDLRFVNKKKFVCIPSYFEGDIWGCQTQMSFKVNFHLLYVDMQDSAAYSHYPFNTDKIVVILYYC